MNVLNVIEYLRKRTPALKIGFFAFLVMIVVLDVFLPREESHYFVDTFYAFWTLFTLVGCFLLIKISKGIAHMFLAKDEDYYG
jgi:drug/metabolite transporter (DMT)-like permease